VLNTFFFMILYFLLSNMYILRWHTGDLNGSCPGYRKRDEQKINGTRENKPDSCCCMGRKKGGKCKNHPERDVHAKGYCDSCYKQLVVRTKVCSFYLFLFFFFFFFLFMSHTMHATHTTQHNMHNTYNSFFLFLYIYI
jgi:hypothetical protein